MIVEREKPLKSNLNRNYWIVENGRHQDLEDITGWCILVAADIENKTDAELESIIADYEENRIGEEYLKEVKDYEGHYSWRDGLVGLDEEADVYSKRNLEDMRAEGGDWADLTIASWVKDGDIFISNYTNQNYGHYRVEKAEDIVNYLKGRTELLKKCEDPTVMSF